MQWVVDLFNMILDGFQAVIDFITKDVFELFRQFGEFIYSFLQMAFYDLLYYATLLLQTIFDSVFAPIDFVGSILSSWLSVPTEVRNALVFFSVPECAGMLVMALCFRFILRLIPFL